MFKRILVPIDGSATSDRALAMAVKLAGESGGAVRVLHDLEDLALLAGPEGAQVLEAAHAQGENLLAKAAQTARAAGVTVDTRLVEAPGERLGEVVAREATHWDADLIVVGTYGRRGISRMVLGSGAEQIVRLAPAPVLTVRGGDTP